MARANNPPDPLMVAVGRVAQASRPSAAQQPGALREARSDLVAARLERAIREAFRPESPYEPIRKRDRLRLARLLREGP